MINPQDEQTLRQLYREMNLGFIVPQNGGVPAQTVAVMKQGKEEADSEETDKDVSQLVSSVIEELQHLKMDLDQGCQGDAQIELLQQVCQSLSQAIDKLGNNSAEQYQSGAFTGAISSDNQGTDTGAETANSFM